MEGTAKEAIVFAPGLAVVFGGVGPSKNRGGSVDWLSQLALSIVTGAAASALTVWFSLGQFRQEKWWERKFEAYAAVIAALHDMRRDLDDIARDAAPPQTPISLEHHRKAIGELHTRSSLGELLFSDDAAAEVEALLEILNRESRHADGDPVGYARSAIISITLSLQRLQPYARRDLRMSTEWTPRGRRHWTPGVDEPEPPKPIRWGYPLYWLSHPIMWRLRPLRLWRGNKRAKPTPGVDDAT